jgi:hypothetical protein
MIIDFHTHFFPDNIAAATIAKLAGIPEDVVCNGDGTLSSLERFMDAHGVAYSVNLPVATKPEQVESINRKMTAINCRQGRVVNFGSMHPRYKNFSAEIEFLKSNGIKGIKMHPEYQEFYPDDDSLAGLYECCAKAGMMIAFHSGIDVAYTGVHGTPKRFAELLIIKGLRIILAHMGGFRMWDEVAKHLLGKDVYFDTAYCCEMPDKLMRDLIFGHGPEKILFATDFPWENAENTAKKIKGLGLGAEVEKKIFFENARQLLDMRAAAKQRGIL